MATPLQGGLSRARKEKVPGSGDTPGARPEFDKPTLLDKAVGFIRGMTKRVNSTGNNVSPTTIKDEKGGNLRNQGGSSSTQSEAELEKIARRYVDRR